MIYSTFLCSTSLDGFERVRIDGVSPHDVFDDLHDAIRSTAGAAAAAVLCEPLVSDATGDAAGSISWYTAFEGQAIPITRMEPARRDAAEALLAARVDAIKAAISRSDKGALLAATLYLPDPSDVYVIGREPVMTNWGIVPTGALSTDSRRRAAFAAGLGAVGVALTAPPLEAEPFDTWRQGLNEGDPTLAPQPSAGSPQTGGEDRPETRRAEAVGMVESGTHTANKAALPFYRKAWFPAAVACILAVLVLALLLIPGVLLFPERTPVSALQQRANDLRNANDGLERRLAELRQARDTGVCTADDDVTFSLPAPVAPDTQTDSVTETLPTVGGSGTAPAEPRVAPAPAPSTIPKAAAPNSIVEDTPHTAPTPNSADSDASVAGDAAVGEDETGATEEDAATETEEPSAELGTSSAPEPPGAAPETPQTDDTPAPDSETTDTAPVTGPGPAGEFPFEEVDPFATN